MTDLARVRKLYKLTSTADARALGAAGKRNQMGVATKTLTNGVGESTFDRKEMEMTILGLMALRGTT